MEANFLKCVTLTKISEGGFSNHPNDAGGATMKGVTLATYRRHKPGATIADLKKITESEVRRIYKIDYWNKVKGGVLPLGLDYTLFDYCINSGPSRPSRSVQKMVGVKADGKIGPITMKAIQESEAEDLILGVNKERLAFMKRSKNRKTGRPLWPTFGRGWQIRVDGVLKDSLSMVLVDPGPPRRTPRRKGLLQIILDLIRSLFKKGK